MMQIFVSLLIFLIVAGNLSASDHVVGISCPEVTVSCVGEDCSRSPFYFKAQLSEIAENGKVSYHWSLPTGQGQIVEGQGTSKVKVVANNSHGVTATVEVQGLTADCGPAIGSITVINEPAPPVQEIDEFGPLPLEKIKSRLDKLAYQLRNQPGAQGYIVSSGKWALSGSAQKYLSREHNLESGRVVYVQRKTKGPIVIKLYVVPAGANPPGS
jgi:PKD-like domain